jgi:hypothetical protein
VANDELLDSEKLLAEMKSDLDALKAVSDPELLTPLALKTVPRMINSYQRLVQPVPMAIISGPDRDLFYRPLIMLLAAAEMAERRSDWKAKLADRLVEYAPQITANLAQTAKIVQRQ